MSTTADHLSDPELLQTEWDLTPLVESEGRAGVERQLAEATDRADAFAARYVGRLATIQPGSARQWTSSPPSTS